MASLLSALVLIINRSQVNSLFPFTVFASGLLQALLLVGHIGTIEMRVAATGRIYARAISTLELILPTGDQRLAVYRFVLVGRAVRDTVAPESIARQSSVMYSYFKLYQ